jgi:hypothetical protein
MHTTLSVVSLGSKVQRHLKENFVHSKYTYFNYNSSVYVQKCMGLSDTTSDLHRPSRTDCL